jgi:hypothetical protein
MFCSVVCDQCCCVRHCKRLDSKVNDDSLAEQTAAAALRTAVERGVCPKELIKLSLIQAGLMFLTQEQVSSIMGKYACQDAINQARKDAGILVNERSK